MAVPLPVDFEPIVTPPAKEANLRFKILNTAGRSYNYTGGTIVRNEVFYVDTSDYAWFLLWSQVPTGLFRYGARGRMGR